MRGMEGYRRGVNLGGWLSQFDAPTKEHFDTFITEADIRRIAGMGLDHVRVPVDYTVIETEDGKPIEEGYQYIDNCVQWCRANGLHMILDIHKTYGYSFDPLDKDADREIFFRVVMPSAGPGVASGTILTFARALGEYGATSMLAGNIPGKTATISQRIAMVIQDGDYLTAGIWVFIVAVISFVIIVLMNLIAGKHMKNIHKW